MKVELLNEDEENAILSVQQYFRDEFDQEISDLKTRLLIEFFLKEVGPFAYNKGVSDSEAFILKKMEDLPGTCHEHPLTYWEK